MTENVQLTSTSYPGISLTLQMVLQYRVQRRSSVRLALQEPGIPMGMPVRSICSVSLVVFIPSWQILIVAAPRDNLVIEIQEYVPRVDCYTSGAEAPDMKSCLVALQSMPASRGKEVFSKHPTTSQIRIPRRISNRKFCHSSFCPSNELSVLLLPMLG